MLQQSYKTSAGSADRVRSVFLFTDGQSTTGLTDVRQIAPIMSAMLQNAISPKIYTFGFGADLDDAMLNAISEEGNGQSTYMEDAESIPSSFACIGWLDVYGSSESGAALCTQGTCCCNIRIPPWLQVLIMSYICCVFTACSNSLLLCYTSRLHV